MTTAGWLIELNRQIKRGKHIILHGNVRDMALLQDKLRNFEDAVDGILRKRHYTLRARYNLADGVTFTEPSMRSRFDTARLGPQACSSSPSGGYNPPRMSAPPGPEPRIQPVFLVEPDQALAAFRQVLSNPQTEPCATTVYFADRLTFVGQSLPLTERRLLVQLNLAAQDSHQHTSGKIAGMRNLLLLVAVNLNAVPSWIYHNNPLFTLISVDPPNQEERRTYLIKRYDKFFGGSDLTVPLEESLLNTFSGLTENLTWWDLEAVRLSSFHSQIPIGRARQLIDLFKHGNKEDPWEKLNYELIQDAGDNISKRVIGQEPAIKAVLDVLVSARGGIKLEGAGIRASRPKGVLFLVGPTGVGKTELAKAVTELIFEDETAFARFDMSEYSEEHSAERLAGAPPGYVGYESGGQLTNRIKRQPFSVILFDEIEKAHHRVMDKFLQILDDGRITDGQGETAYFSQSLIIFTSNIGSICVEKDSKGHIHHLPAINNAMAYEELVTHYRGAVRNHFLRINRPEIMGRIGEENIIVFDMLRKQYVGPILKKFLDCIAESTNEKYKVRLHFDESIIEHAIEITSGSEAILLGYRSLRIFAQSKILPVLTREVLKNSQSAGGDGKQSELFIRWANSQVAISPMLQTNHSTTNQIAERPIAQKCKAKGFDLNRSEAIPAREIAIDSTEGTDGNEEEYKDTDENPKP